MDDVLKWAEQSSAENMKFRLQTAEQLSKDANTALTLLLAGVGGALAFVAKALENTSHQPSTILAGAGSLSIWFMVLAVLTLHFCIQTRPLPAPTNEPQNLNQPDFDLEALRQVEIKNLQERINDVVDRNSEVATRLDQIRYASAASPLVFITAVLVSAHWPGLSDLFARALAGG